MRYPVGLPLEKPLVRAAMILAVVAALAAGLWSAGDRAHAPKRPPPFSDAALYRGVIDQVRAGTPYYEAALTGQRAHHYPVKPFVAVRPPTLAWAMAALPGELARRVALGALALAALAAWALRRGPLDDSEARSAIAPALVATGIATAFTPLSYLFHEVWAGLFIALSLGLRRPDRWGASVAMGLAAALTRELAAAYLLAMAVCAWREGRRREALAWALALGLVAAALAVHATMVARQLVPGDLASQGWLKAGGWSFVLATLRWNAVFVVAPDWALALCAPFALLGLAMWRSPLGERVALTVLGYVAAFFFVGRPDNAYWGLLIAPLWPLGLALAPASLAALWSGVMGRRRATPETPIEAAGRA